MKDSRAIKSELRRRRACPQCDRRWTTYEVHAEEIRTKEQLLRDYSYIKRFGKAILNIGLRGLNEDTIPDTNTTREKRKHGNSKTTN